MYISRLKRPEKTASPRIIKLAVYIFVFKQLTLWPMNNLRRTEKVAEINFNDNYVYARFQTRVFRVIFTYSRDRNILKSNRQSFTARPFKIQRLRKYFSVIIR